MLDIEIEKTHSEAPDKGEKEYYLNEKAIQKRLSAAMIDELKKRIEIARRWRD